MSTENHPLNLAQIRTDGGTQTRATLNAETIREYAEAMSRGEQFPPVVVFYDGSHYWLADGFHRIQAAKDAGQDEIDADIHQGTQRDAVLHSVAANAKHGLPRSAEDKRRAVLRLLEDDEWSTWSDRKIAEATNTSHPFVGKLRRDVYGDDIPAERTVERDGQQYTMSTDGINADRDAEMIALANDYAEMIALANDYADLIPSLLPPAGLLYDELREQLAVDASDSMQIRAYRRALEDLSDQQQIVKDGARYKVAEGEPFPDEDEPFPVGTYVTVMSSKEFGVHRIGIVRDLQLDIESRYLVEAWDTSSANHEFEHLPASRLKIADDWDYEHIWIYSTRQSKDELLLIGWKDHYISFDWNNDINRHRYNFAYPTPRFPDDKGLAVRISPQYVKYFTSKGGSVQIFDDIAGLDERMQAIATKAGRARGGEMLYPPEAANADLIDLVDPVTAQVTQVPASASEPDPDAETREWFRKQLHETPRHYNILSRIAREDNIPTKVFIRVARAMIDDGEVELDGMIYKLAGDTREQPALPDELSADQKAAVRDALIDAVRNDALVSTQINNAIHAATGKKLDILYLINWLDLLALDEKLIKTVENGHMPTYQLNPNPPSDAEIQARRQAADINTRLDIVRQALTNRVPSESISVRWLKRAAPGAASTAAEAGDLLTRLVDLGELRLTGGGTVNYELVEVSGAAESTDPGQDGEPTVERPGEPRGRDELQPQPDEHAQQYSTALLHRGQFERALFALDDAFKAVRVIRSIQTWHTLDEQQIDKTRELIAMTRTWLFNFDGFLEAFDDALAEITATGEPYLGLVEAKPVEDEVEVQA